MGEVGHCIGIQSQIKYDRSFLLSQVKANKIFVILEDYGLKDLTISISLCLINDSKLFYFILLRVEGDGRGTCILY